MIVATLGEIRQIFNTLHTLCKQAFKHVYSLLYHISLTLKHILKIFWVTNSYVDDNKVVVYFDKQLDWQSPI